MAIDWRPLLDSIRQPWKDRGPNTSAGNVNVCCPWCNDDRGFHLTISESKEAFYCYRQPLRHSGTSLIRLLVGLGVSRDESVRLLNRFSSGKRSAAAPKQSKPRKADGQAARTWARFIHACEHAGCADYLRLRGYPHPERISLRFDLRCSTEGRWANRLLLPIKSGPDILSWTGRAIRENLTPKYLAEADDSSVIPLLYVPDEAPFWQSGTRAIIVEGPLDALKLAAVGKPRVGAIALTGKALNPTKLLRLRILLAECSRVDLLLDNDAGLSEKMSLMNELRGAGIQAPIRRARLPEEFKDAGEMPLEDAALWLEQSHAA